MKGFTQFLWKLKEDESGQDLVEYALVVALIALASVATMKGFATSLTAAFTGISNKINSAV